MTTAISNKNHRMDEKFIVSFNTKKTEQTINLWNQQVERIINIIKTQKTMFPKEQFTNSDLILCWDWQSTSTYIINGLTSLATADRVDNSRKIFEVLDIDNTAQAIAYLIIEKDHVFLQALITAPWNLKFKKNFSILNFPTRKKGAGTTAVMEALKIAKNLGKPTLQTNPLESAESFYKNLGMIPLNDLTLIIKV